ncbi:MAG: PepSY-associated TM helix domain-containing protein [Pseudomonadota bacterium]
MAATGKPNSDRVAKALHAHQVVALALGTLIYVLAVTGTLSVFNREIQRWEQPDAPEMTAISPTAAAAAAATVFESEETPTTHLYINFPQPDLPRTVITTDTQAFFANPDGTVAGREHFPWTQFLLDLHYYLHLPQILGLTVVGALGAFLIAMSISGFIAHPRIFRDAFTFRRGAGLLPLADLHNRLSVWTAPFHISNALTGALLGLASILAFAIAASSFEGDTNRVFAPVFGGEGAPSEETAPLANIEGPLSYMAQEFPQLPLTFFILHDPGTAGQHSSVIAKHEDRLIFGDYYNFDAAGRFEGNVGLSDGTVGQQIIGSVYNVHFGNWGGLAVKLAYGLFGVILCIIIASGMRIYFLRRQQKGRPAPRLAAGWEAVVWGTPAVLAATLLAAVGAGLEGSVLVATFWAGLVLTVVISGWTGQEIKVRRLLKLATALLLILAVAVHGLTHGTSAFGGAAWPISVAGISLGVAALALLARGSATLKTEPPSPTLP